MAMELSSRDWSQQYESLKKRIQNQRISGAIFTSDEIRQIEKQIGTLEVQLKSMSGKALQYELAASEIARRETLLENMKTMTSNLFGKSSGGSGLGGSNQTGKDKSPYSSSGGASQSQLQHQAAVMKMQDEMVLEIGAGVGRLHGKAQTIGEESKAHVRLLDDLDSNVDIATAALQQEAQHAAEIKEKGKVCYMYICIGIEVVVLFIMIIVAVKP